MKENNFENTNTNNIRAIDKHIECGEKLPNKKILNNPLPTICAYIVVLASTIACPFIFVALFFQDSIQLYLEEDAIYERSYTFKIFELIIEDQIAFSIVLFVAVILLLLSVVLILTYGTSANKHGEYTFSLNQRVMFEIQVTILFCLLVLFVDVFISQLSWIDLYLIDYVMSCIPIAWALVLVGMQFLQSNVKRFKAHKFWHYTIVGRIFALFKRVFDRNDNVTLKIIGAIAAGGVVLMVLPFPISVLAFTILMVLTIAYIPKYSDKFMEIRNKTAKMSEGAVDERIVITGDGELSKLARNINEISKGANIAIQNEMKNQRLKVDLISNVSHDIKTPLTSMITYVDLMKKEELNNEKALEYLTIIDQKTQRLKKLTDDLFEAAKASSGAIKVNMEKIEMVSLINQVLGEIDDKLNAANLECDFSYDDMPMYVNADGQLMFRVFDNLLLNATKYSLEGSRIYIKVKKIRVENSEVERAVIEIKNVSKNKLNISAEELMERFVRGEEERSTEGSGLGLAIAQDLTKLMGGELVLAVDGDIFMAKVSFCLI